MYPDFQAIAEEALVILHKHIDLDKEEIREEHSFHDKILVLNHVLVYLSHTITPSSLKAYDLLSDLIDNTEHLENLLRSYRFHELHLVKDEQKDEKKLAYDLKHQDWKAIKLDTSRSEKDSENDKKLSIGDLTMITTTLGGIITSIHHFAQSDLPKTKEVLIMKSLTPLQHALVEYYKVFSALIEKEKKLQQKA